MQWDKYMQLDSNMTDVYLFGGAGLFLLFVFFLMTGSNRKKQLEARVSRLKQTKKPAGKKGEAEKTSLRRQTSDASLSMVTNATKSMSFMDKLRGRLEVAGMELTAERYLVISIIIMLVATLTVIFTLGKPVLLGLLVGLVAGLGIPHIYVGMRTNSRKKKFLNLFPDAIDLVVRGLRAGLPVTKSMQTVADEIEDPLAEIFREMVDQMALGVPLEKALYKMAEKLDITEFNFFVTSIILQRETGGNLAEILSNLSEVLRSRHMFKMKIKAMSMEAKASAYIVGSLPIFVFAALSFMSPGYMDPFYDDYRGNIAAFGGAFSMGFGLFVMFRITKFEI